ncbi:DUF4037 domain-containing protein [Streptomyces sp. NPDC050287]|uniref:DUF4037 domain-containing protein n=1 Tax=Streptomyces sp. NPDC050287 TaxID=3365608 RepID=UPI00379CC05E
MTFIQGLELSRRFYTEAVRPLLEDTARGLPHSAARIGSGSEVLGFDTPRSADHEWGPRLQLFLRPEDAPHHAERLSAYLSEHLPKTFLGYPTHFAPTEEPHVRVMRRTDGPVHHRIDIADVPTWFTHHLGFDPTTGIPPETWLSTPTQLLAEATEGAVFHDGLGTLTPVRASLAWYPHDIWLRTLADHWRHLAEEEAFVGRCGEVGDELGSAIVAARQTRHLMRLCLLMHHRYPPYSKWLGSAFTRTPTGARLTPVLTAALAATDWRTREERLCQAYETVAGLHNKLGLTDPVDQSVRPYHSRPFRVLGAERFAAALEGRGREKPRPEGL